VKHSLIFAVISSFCQYVYNVLCARDILPLYNLKFVFLSWNNEHFIYLKAKNNHLHTLSSAVDDIKRRLLLFIHSVDRTRHSQYICLHLAMVTKWKLRGSMKEHFKDYNNMSFVDGELLLSISYTGLLIKNCCYTHVEKLPGNLRYLYSRVSYYDVAFHKVDFYLARLTCIRFKLHV
jgi:hypothetical protein